MQKFLSRLFQRLMKSWSWIVLVILTIAIKWVSLYPGWVEQNYTYGLYPVVSQALRILFGWIPFSIGDLFYGFFIAIILFRVVKFFRLLFQKKLNRAYFGLALRQLIFLFLLVYVSFNILWGLNYNRHGIAHQLGLEVRSYTTDDLDTLCKALQPKLNYYAGLVDTLQREKDLAKKKHLFHEAALSYELAKEKYPFLAYPNQSMKTSLVGFLGKYVVFQGYYNPFTGDVQVKASIPRFLQPFVTSHEIAHQLGYAKENEANFVGYLAARESSSNDFRYSAYYDVYQYAFREYARSDRKKAIALDSTLHPIAKRDRWEYNRYLYKMNNRVAPFMLKMYDGYLKMNNQPKGYRTYNEVVTWLVAYYKKYGVAAL